MSIFNKIKPKEDLIKFVGRVMRLELDGKAEDLPLSIGSFKCTGSRENKQGRFLVGLDEESMRLIIPVESIEVYRIYEH